VIATATESRPARLGPAFRQGDRVMPLELFFDLVFVLAITQCTTLMSHDTTWTGLGRGLLVLALLWWSWAAYAWLTSLLDPEEGAVRIVLFAAMAGFLIAAICVPNAFGSLGTEFAVAYGAVRAAHIALFFISSRDDPGLRRSTWGIASGTALGITLLVIGSLLDPGPQAAIWGLALILDMLEPYVFGSEGWHLVPGHFAERHGLIILIALGESIVAIGIGAQGTMSWGIAAAATLGIALVAALWWLYFDIVALVSARRLADTPEGKIRNELARDSYSYIHFLMVAGIILLALGLKKTLGHVDDPLHTVPAFALLAGVALYLLGLVAFRYRHVKSVNWRRVGLAAVLIALLPAATALPAIAILAVVVLLLWILVTIETRSYGEGRAEVRHGEAFPAAR
jgi:low temperature requirement protein LtrA